jgi:hypothetical protein
LSPNRFNGLYNAGRAAEASGNKAQAKSYLRNAAAVDRQRRPFRTRPEFEHMKAFDSSTALLAP